MWMTLLFPIAYLIFYADGELLKDSTVSKMEIVLQEGTRHVKRKQIFYNLDVIISVGYRRNSRRAAGFLIWAASVLKKFAAGENVLLEFLCYVIIRDEVLL